MYSIITHHNPYTSYKYPPLANCWNRLWTGCHVNRAVNLSCMAVIEYDRQTNVISISDHRDKRESV